jgi:hypothetical protein
MLEPTVLRQLPRWLSKSHVVIGAPVKHVFAQNNAAMAMDPARCRAASVPAKAAHVHIPPHQFLDMTRMRGAR